MFSAGKMQSGMEEGEEWGTWEDIVSDILELSGDKVGKKIDSPKCHAHFEGGNR